MCGHLHKVSVTETIVFVQLIAKASTLYLIHYEVTVTFILKEIKAKVTAMQIMEGLRPGIF